VGGEGKAGCGIPLTANESACGSCTRDLDCDQGQGLGYFCAVATGAGCGCPTGQTFCARPT
jgi:hypothetical protein